MKLILIRHGQDLQSPGGEARLSHQGRSKIQSTAKSLAETGVTQIDIARASSALRAQESLDELSNVIEIADRQVSPNLQPESPAEHLDTLILEHGTPSDRTVLVIGHEPQLSNAVLRWCGLPENDPVDGDRPPWILSRGEGVVLQPEISGSQITTNYKFGLWFLGRDKPLPADPEIRRAGVF